ncbi:hypothetical protein [Paenibacillus dauci]|uniref:hypothetical protein n=1 Tax=Paenibacillus dauci TaxID=1567106 RepID=UPI00061A0935|nr:hypothetical protein [Paenibacillus dauci]
MQHHSTYHLPQQSAKRFGKGVKSMLLLLLVAVLWFAAAGPAASSVQAAPAKNSTYQQVALYVNGNLQITVQRSQLVNGNTLYIPVKIMDRIPGITINYGSPLSLTGSKGSVTINNSNSFQYTGVTYVQFKSLLAISDLESKFASSALALFIWDGDKGKAESSKILTNISQLPAGVGKKIGQKIYPFQYSGAYWITDISYDPGSTVYYNTAINSGGEEIQINANAPALDFVLESDLLTVQNWLRGQNVWFDNRNFNGSGVKHLEKLTFVSFQVDDDNNFSIVVRNAKGKLLGINVAADQDATKMALEYLFTKNPRSVYKWSNSVWNTISQNRVTSGMSREQVVMSWGLPIDANTYQSGSITYEQWIYNHNQYLYFWNGKLSSAQNL